MPGHGLITLMADRFRIEGKEDRESFRSYFKSTVMYSVLTVIMAVIAALSLLFIVIAPAFVYIVTFAASGLLLVLSVYSINGIQVSLEREIKR